MVPISRVQIPTSSSVQEPSLVLNFHRFPQSPYFSQLSLSLTVFLHYPPSPNLWNIVSMSVQTAFRSASRGTLRSPLGANITRGPLTPPLPTRSLYHTHRLVPSTSKVSPAKTLICNRNPHGLIRCLPSSSGIGNAALSPRLYSTLPDSYPRNPGAWSRWVVKLLLHWEGRQCPIPPSAPIAHLAHLN